MHYLAIGAHCLIGAVFLVSSVGKVAGRSFNAFVSSVRDMRLLPAPLVTPVATLVVAAEFAVCALLVLPFRTAAVTAFLVAAVLLVAFAIAITLSVRRGTSTACRCFGVSTVPLGPWHVVRNIALTAVAAVGVVTTAAAAGQVEPAGVTVAVLAGLVSGLVITMLDDIVGLFQPVRR